MRLLPLLVLVAVGVLVSGCAPSHRLAEVELAERSVAVIAAIPPTPLPVTGPWPPDPGAVRPPGVVGRRLDGTRAAQGRLDRAAAQIDVAERIARHALAGSAQALAFRPAADPATADFVLDVRLLEYGFFARSFDSTVQFLAEADVLFVDRATNEVLWTRRVRTREAVAPEQFGVTDGRRLSVADFTRLSTEEMAFGLEVLADIAALRIVEDLASAYAGRR